MELCWVLHEVLDVVRTAAVHIQSQCELEVDLFVRSLKFHYKPVHFAKLASVFMGMKPDYYARFELTLFSKKSCMKMFLQ